MAVGLPPVSMESITFTSHKKKKKSDKIFRVNRLENRLATAKKELRLTD
jgi:hypothetical protein